MWKILIAIMFLINMAKSELIEFDQLSEAELEEYASTTTSSDTIKKENNIVTKEELEKYMTKHRIKARDELVEELIKPDLNHLFANPVLVVNYLRVREARKKKDRFRSGQIRKRRASPVFKQPQGHVLLKTPEDIATGRLNSFLVEMYPSDLSRLKANSWIHIIVCGKPGIPENVDTDRKIVSPYENCKQVQNGEFVFIDPENFRVPWMFRKFVPNERILIKVGQDIWLRYYPLSRQTEYEFSSDSICYTHESNRSAMISILYEESIFDKDIEISVEADSSTNIPYRVHRQPEHSNQRVRRSSDYIIGSNIHVTSGKMRSQPKQTSISTYSTNVVVSSEMLNFMTNASEIVVIYNPQIMSVGNHNMSKTPTDKSWGQPVMNSSFLPSCFNEISDKNDNNCLSPSAVQKKIFSATLGDENIYRERRDAESQYSYNTVPKIKHSILLPQIRKNEKVFILQENDTIFVQCFAPVPDVNLRINSEQGIFKSERIFEKPSENSSTLLSKLTATRATFGFTKNSIKLINGDLFIDDKSYISRVTCTEYVGLRHQKRNRSEMLPESLWFSVFTPDEYSNFIELNVEHLRTGYDRVQMLSLPKVSQSMNSNLNMSLGESIRIIVIFLLTFIPFAFFVCIAVYARRLINLNDNEQRKDNKKAENNSLRQRVIAGILKKYALQKERESENEKLLIQKSRKRTK